MLKIINQNVIELISPLFPSHNFDTSSLNFSERSLIHCNWVGRCVVSSPEKAVPCLSASVPGMKAKVKGNSVFDLEETIRDAWVDLQTTVWTSFARRSWPRELRQYQSSVGIENISVTWKWKLPTKKHASLHACNDVQSEHYKFNYFIQYTFKINVTSYA